MSDQAEKLRRLTEGASAPTFAEAAPLPMVVVAGARKGVGATTVAVNLAAAIADRGERVVVVDAAEGGNNLANVAGVGRETRNCVADVVNGTCGVADALVDGPMGIRVLINRGRIGFDSDRETRRHSLIADGESSRAGQQRLLSSIDALCGNVDLVVVDAGSGLTAWTRRFWLRAQCVVLVSTADDASVMDAYSAIKSCAVDGICPVVRLLVNCETNGAAAVDAQRRVQNACQKFLSLSVEALPALPLDESEFVAGASRGPRVWEQPNSAFSRATLWLGRAVSETLAGESRTISACPRSRFNLAASHEHVGASGGMAPTKAWAQRRSGPNPVEIFLQAADRIASY